MLEGFAASGHRVYGCARSLAAVEQLRRDFPTGHEFAVVDVACETQVREWAESLLARGVIPDLLVNNAAVINRNAVLWETAVEDFDQVMRCNVNGTFYTIRHFVPAMVKRGQGIIVNFSSGWGRSTSPEVAPYCATKYAVEGLTLALAQELPQGMAAVALNPGIINTEMLRSCFGGDAASYPTPKQWAKSAVPFILKLSARDNGSSTTVPL
jgi:NAD(P)-dependent dehydrogenase (short-subunit alcohol dehydrogenase family)